MFYLSCPQKLKLSLTSNCAFNPNFDSGFELAKESKGVEMEEWSAYKIQLHGIE
jgi:hypothetical protein